MLMSGEGLECGRSGDIHRTKRFLDDGEREDVKEALAQKNLLGWADLGAGGTATGRGEGALGTGQWPTGQACEELLASRLLWRSLGLAGCEGKWPLLLVLSGWPCLQRDSVPAGLLVAGASSAGHLSLHSQVPSSPFYSSGETLISCNVPTQNGGGITPN